MIQLCEKKRTPQPKYILVDTPGQIEIFTWSASGAIITEAFASTFPTMIAYVVDTARSAAPQTFMSNMLQVWLDHRHVHSSQIPQMPISAKHSTTGSPCKGILLVCKF